MERRYRGATKSRTRLISLTTRERRTKDISISTTLREGGKIEGTPYEPQREGYTFGGWYKEPECVNKWDFETDKLPEATYDEEGYITDFVETKLYAAWIKN